jgi:hypothetical protein
MLKRAAEGSRLMSRALGTYCRRLVAAPAYLAAKGVPLIPDDLKAHACLHHKFPTSRKLERWPVWPEHAGIETEPPGAACEPDGLCRPSCRRSAGCCL